MKFYSEFHFFGRDFAICNTFWGGTSQKRHPVDDAFKAAKEREEFSPSLQFTCATGA